MADQTPADRLRCFLAVEEAEGGYDDTQLIEGVNLTFGDLRAVLAKADTLKVVDLARVAVKPGDTILVRPKESTGIIDADQAGEWAEYLRETWGPHLPGVKFFVLPLECEVAVIEGGRADRCAECGQSVYLENGRIGFHPTGEDGNQHTCPGAGHRPGATAAATAPGDNPTRGHWPRDQRMPTCTTLPAQWYYRQAITEYRAEYGVPSTPPVIYTAAKANQAVDWWNQRAAGLRGVPTRDVPEDGTDD